ncbi:hypothetical protein [Flavobacterium hibisci]|uniref:hypothetical protein n=1 Tax=Flavobacterium hibisci TaxID=1914462 RepID=UPI001CBDC41E|nr:hypothetical protein [Flavobacterium hibisci]MBZ4042668.1 hypothetical protein [Flavobacterium hibisci]
MNNRSELKLLAKKYLSARREFLSAIREDHPELGGNDNIVGRIGEFVALQFLENSNRRVQKCKSATNKGFDIVCSNGRQISVKTITAESKTGRSTKLKQPWQELIIIYIGKNYEVETIGHIHVEDYDIAISKKAAKEDQVTDKRLLLEGGLFSEYGKLYTGELVKNYL